MKHTLYAFVVAALLFSCKKDPVEGPPGPQGPQGPSGSGTTGIITGTVSQFDQHNERYTTGLNTTTVSLKGSNHSTMTDAQGAFTLSGISAGIYDITLTKPGCGLVEVQQVVFPGSGTMLWREDLYDKATHSILTCTLKDSMSSFQPSPILFLRITVTPHEKIRGGIILFGKNNNLDINDPASYESFYHFTIPPNTSSYQSMVYNNNLNSTTTYAKVYPNNASTYSSGYWDILSDQTIYTCTGPVFPTTFTITRP